MAGGIASGACLPSLVPSCDYKALHLSVELLARRVVSKRYTRCARALIFYLVAMALYQEFTQQTQSSHS